MPTGYRLLSAACLLAVAAGASAQVANLQSRTSADLSIDGVGQPLDTPVASPYFRSGTGGAGAGYSSSAIIGTESIFFQAGAMAAGFGNAAKSVVEVSFDVINDQARPIDQMVSTIFESNFGLHVANFSDIRFGATSIVPEKLACTGSDLANCTPTGIAPGFSAFVSVSDQTPPSTLAFTSFAFEVLQEDAVVGSVAGSIRLDRLSDGSLAFIQSPGFADLAGSLSNFTQFSGAPDQVYAFSWDNSHFTADLNPILQGQTSKLTYRVTTQSWTDVTFQGAFDNLIVAFACFADPVGRGSTAALFTIPGFGPSTCNDYSDGSPSQPSPYRLGVPVVRDGKILFTSGGAVPEPDTWAMLILGFGLIGFSMRRRSATATPA